MSTPRAGTSSRRRKPRTSDDLCSVCSSRIHKVTEPLFYRGFFLGEFEVLKCPACGETVFPHAAWKAIRKLHANFETFTSPTIGFMQIKPWELSSVEVELYPTELRIETMPFQVGSLASPSTDSPPRRERALETSLR